MTVIKISKTSKIVFILSLFTALFWCIGQLVNVYYFAISGAIFEILWLPMLVLLFVLPLFSLTYWVKEKFNLKSLYLYSLLIILSTAVFIYLKN
jgi:hypothetical protein